MGPILAAFVTGLITLIGQILLADRKPRGYKRLALQIDLWAKLPDGMAAKESLNDLINRTASVLRDKEASSRPLNPTNVVLTTVLGGALGYGCYWLWVWANSSSPVPVLAWILFVVASLATLLFMGGAVGTLRNPTRPKVERQAEKERRSAASLIAEPALQKE